MAKTERGDLFRELDHSQLAMVTGGAVWEVIRGPDGYGKAVVPDAPPLTSGSARGLSAKEIIVIGI
jgi:hypothetical protein